MSNEETQKEVGSGDGGATEEPAGSMDATAHSAATEESSPPTDELVSLAPPPPPPLVLAPPKDHEHVYHLCRKQDWEDAKESQTPYFPRTFLEDGKFTRASFYLDDIADVANEYYCKTSPPEEDWIVLEINVQFLYHGLGIPVLANQSGEADANANVNVNAEVNADADPLGYLQVFGGVSTHPNILESLIASVYSMKRRDVDGKFIGMLHSKWAEGVFDSPSPKNRTAPKTEDGGDYEVDDILEIPTGESSNEIDKNNATTTTKTKKKKKGFFSKLKVKKGTSVAT
jgi:hypothetical protein